MLGDEIPIIRAPRDVQLATLPPLLGRQDHRQDQDETRVRSHLNQLSAEALA